jgi:glyoxylase-like metal-dependent hydrolase (beta-lactamase superfamily II)
LYTPLKIFPIKKTNVLLPLLLALFTTILEAQEKETIVTVDTLSNTIFMLTGKGGNVGLFIGASKAYMIDDQYDFMSYSLKETIAGLTSKPIAYLFNTHLHGDHTGGNSNFNSEATTIVAHDNARKRLKEQANTTVEITKGKTLDEVKNNKGITAAYDAVHGGGCIKPEVMRETFYRSLSKE